MWTGACCAARRRFVWERRRENRPTLNSLNSGLGHVFCSSHHLRCSLCLDDFNYSAIKLSYAAYVLSEIPIWYLLWMFINVEMCVRLSGCLYGNNWWPSFISLKLQFNMSDIRFCDVQMIVIWHSPSNLSIIWIIYLDMHFSMSVVNPTRCFCTFRPACSQLQYWKSLTPFLTADLSVLLNSSIKALRDWDLSDKGNWELKNQIKNNSHTYEQTE